MKKLNNQQKIMLSDAEIQCIYNYLKRNGFPFVIDEDTLDEFISVAGNEDGRLALLEDNSDFVLDREYIENISQVAAQIVNKWENYNLDFDDANKKLSALNKRDSNNH